MKKITHKYITSWFIPFYKRKIAPKFKLWYDKYIDWKYGIKSTTYDYNRKIESSKKRFGNPSIIFNKDGDILAIKGRNIKHINDPIKRKEERKDI